MFKKLLPNKEINDGGNCYVFKIMTLLNMSQVIVEQQFHYTTNMTSNNYFPNAIYANRNAKLETFFTCGRCQNSLHSQNFCSGKNFH